MAQTYVKQGFLALFLVFAIPVIAIAQGELFNEQDFFNSIKSSYYNLSQTRLKNMSALVTSTKLETFAKETWNNSEIYPLQLIWFNPDKIYLSESGVPKLDEKQKAEYRELLDGLKLQVKGVLMDLQRFYLVGIFESIQPDYVLSKNEEAVQINFEVHNATSPTRVKYLFGYNGLNILIQIEYPSEQKQTVIYPQFKTVKNKWLCTGWSVQNFVLGEVNSGFTLKINNRLVEDIWVPGELLIEVQKADTKGQTYYDAIVLRNFLFDQPLKLNDTPNANR